MKLLCIAVPPNVPKEYKHLTPQVLSEYTWVADWIDGNGKKYYILAEMPDYCVYDPQMFAVSNGELVEVIEEQEAMQC